MTIAPSTVDVAKAVATVISDNAGDLPAEFTLSRRYIPQRKISGDGIFVTVAGGRFNLDRLDRSSLRSDLPVLIVVSAKLEDAEDVAAIDAVINFAEELAELLFAHPQPTDGVHVMSVETTEPTPDHEALLKHKLANVYLRAAYERMEL